MINACTRSLWIRSYKILFYGVKTCRSIIIIISTILISTSFRDTLYFTIWYSSIANNIATLSYHGVKFLSIIFVWLSNWHGLCLQERRLVLIFLLAGSRFPPIWINKVTVFTHSLLYKRLIGYDLLIFYDIQVTYMKFINKIGNLLVPMILPKIKSGIRSILNKKKM